MLSLLPPAIESPHTTNARVLGEGANSIVYRSSFKTGTVALKVPRVGHEKALKRESKAFRDMGDGCANIVTLVGTFEVGCGVGLILEAYEVDLLTEISKSGPFPCKRAAVVTWQLCSALTFLYEKELVVCDLKPENVLLRRSADGDHVAVADFGLVHTVGEHIKAPIGTASYIPSEGLRPGAAATSRDMWALGVVLFALLSATSAFDRGCWRETRVAIAREDPPLWSLPRGVSAEAKALIVRLLGKRPENRPAARELLEIDPFVLSGSPGV
jgi:serine/threonine protein kinase